MNLFVVFGIIFVVSPALGLDPLVEKLCPPSAVEIVGEYFFRTFRDICYLFATYDHTVYPSAQFKCQQHGGTLAMPKTKDVNDFLLLQMADMSDTIPMWIGMNDMLEEGTVVWEDGTDVEWENFDWFIHGFMGGMEDCVALDPDDGEWHDYICEDPWVPGFTTSHKKPFICQYTLN